MNHNQNLIILLCGGDKSTQTQDIKQAKALSKTVKSELKGEK